VNEFQEVGQERGPEMNLGKIPNSAIYTTLEVYFDEYQVMEVFEFGEECINQCEDGFVLWMFLVVCGRKMSIRSKTVFE